VLAETDLGIRRQHRYAAGDMMAVLTGDDETPTR
jgi:hypothetical protein